MVQFRKSKSFGPVRLTASKRGISTSVGAGPFRVSFGADGKTRRTVRVPGTGIYDTKVIGGNKRSTPGGLSKQTSDTKTKTDPGTGSLIFGIVVFGGGALWLMSWAIGAHAWWWLVIAVPVLLFTLLAIAGAFVEANNKRREIRPADIYNSSGVAQPRLAGWYPDQMQPGRERWWSGTAWSTNTRWPD